VNPVRASLIRTNPPAKPGEPSVVPFALNPERITISHYAHMTDVAASADEAETLKRIRKLGDVGVGVDRLVVLGPKTKEYCDALLKWSTPLQSTVNRLVTIPIDLLFSWGQAFRYTVHLHSVTVNYVRFAGATGAPIRADVTLGMTQFVRAKPGTNPTSGGPPGRGGHVLDRSESLPTLATARYGRPSAWRDLARANGIDDPLRVRPGTALYLPEPGELADPRRL
jgi:hypothetical protein